ncbi:MAG: helix-turn-helix domain-containing protein [Alphaproteobacteria bacterium]|nr:helix-turn-helix domain-containing protein [Alphaproteobacteria bacterium]
MSRLDSLTDVEIERSALLDFDNTPLSDEDMRRMTLVYSPEQIRALRARVGLSRAEFARRFGLQARQLQDWEQGRKVPSASVHTLFRVIEREPDAVVRALRK